VIIVYGLMVSCVAAGVCAYESPKSINHQSRTFSKKCKGKGGQDWYLICEVVQQGDDVLRAWNISWASSSHSGVNVLKLVVIFIFINNCRTHSASI
jgi:hypothetical protein